MKCRGAGFGDPEGWPLAGAGGKDPRSGSRASRLLLTASLGLTLLAGCAVAPTLQPKPGSALMSGRLSVSTEALDGRPAQSIQAAFELTGDARTGGLNLSGPLGALLVQARWAPGSVRLVTPAGERRFADLDALTREALGESLPVVAWFDWLAGRPWPGAPSQMAAATSAPGFEQLGWAVNLRRLADGRISAQRMSPPGVSVVAQLDRP